MLKETVSIMVAYPIKEEELSNESVNNALDRMMEMCEDYAMSMAVDLIRRDYEHEVTIEEMLNGTYPGYMFMSMFWITNGVIGADGSSVDIDRSMVPPEAI